MFQIASGMEEIHKVGIIHSDLSSLNILLTKTFDIKISDFGFSIINKEVEGGNGALTWRAPETILKRSKTKQTVSCTNKIDIWSFGIIVWELFHVPDLPYGMALEDDIRKSILNADLPIIKCEEKYSKLIRSCLSQNPADRPSFTEIIQKHNR